jgi:hypothetical protein
LPVAEPAPEAAGAPVGEVLALDGFAAELGGEDFADNGKLVEPGKDLGIFVAIKEAIVELFAEFAGKTGDLAPEGVLGFFGVGSCIREGRGHRGWGLRLKG